MDRVFKHAKDLFSVVAKEQFLTPSMTSIKPLAVFSLSQCFLLKKYLNKMYNILFHRTVNCAVFQII